MKYTREALSIASLVIGILSNGLFFKIGFWMPDGIVTVIALWIVATGIITYCSYRFLLAIAKGGIEK